VDNFTLNLYKAFGIRKATDEGLYITRTGERGGTKKHKSPRAAMTHAIKQMMKGTLSGVFITHPVEYGDSGAMSKLYRHPETGNLTLGHGTHENYLGADATMGYPDDRNVNLPKRDIQAFDKLKLLHKNSLLSLKSHGDVPMDIDTSGLTNLPKELHTTTERVYPWSNDYFDPNYNPNE